jgi:DNA gyrase/topoisomerase IV, subunit A
MLIQNLSSHDTSAALLEKIADLVNDKKLEGISDLRDESDRDGIRVVVELKRDAVAALVQNNLFKKTSLQWAFSGEGALFFDSPCPSRQKQQASPLVFLCLNQSIIFSLSLSLSPSHSLYIYLPRITVSSSYTSEALLDHRQSTVLQ